MSETNKTISESRRVENGEHESKPNWAKLSKRASVNERACERESASECENGQSEMRACIAVVAIAKEKDVGAPCCINRADSVTNAEYCPSTHANASKMKKLKKKVNVQQLKMDASSD